MLDSGYLFWWCVRGAGAGAGAGSCCITTWEAEVERTLMVPALSLAKGRPVSLPKLEFLFICNMGHYSDGVWLILDTVDIDTVDRYGNVDRKRVLLSAHCH